MGHRQERPQPLVYNKMSIMDGVVPCIEEWEKELDGPILNDLFIGSIEPPLVERPPSVVFVEPKADISGEYATTDALSSPSFFNASSSIGNTFMANGFASATTASVLETDTVGTWMEQTFDLTTPVTTSLNAMAYTNFPVTSASYVPPTSHVVESEAYFSALANSEFDELMDIAESEHSTESITPTIAGPTSVTSGTDSWSYDDDWGSDSSSPSQDEIFEEIQRECAEIERKSTSPVSRTIGTSKKSHRKNRFSTHGLTEERKRELNRIAATKYREKKRRERDGVSSELSVLQRRNVSLKTELSSLETEVKYLKNLIKDIENRRKH
jgi:hypothetical protein